ncbi:DUF1353 domain-containing protein [Tritonibacter mobilis]|uniref:DUF1353 domain-containing protein n=1 Tax=Tritonibacter mobilis TaxID=379347 RepID=UPI001C0944A7|nr:DUF1353 domain-containing protein [Tritonibacter mobilis]MBU3033927.1 DUF1353 domain-containing protein [Tritonibacter mobilis]MCA2008021.1 DUF1353 domain-containing protein [Tritonibacter mobilis]WHQ84977.1 DUF1353 domain-containing protein [Tritonibacter mobilis]
MRRKFILSTFAIFAAQIVVADTYWGKFSDGPHGTFHDGDPWQEFELANPFYFDDPNGLRWEVPAQTRVNGASIPPTFWSLIGGPFTGKYLKASVIHDYFVVTRERTAHDTHRNFYYGMLANGVSLWRAKAMYWAVSTFGADWELRPTVTYRSSCTGDVLGMTKCSAVPVIDMQPVSVTIVDLSEPEQAQLALAKFAAVARTLKSSDGTILDVNASGPVPADLATLELNARVIGEAIAQWGTPGELNNIGILSDWATFTGGEVMTWSPDATKSGTIPDFREAMPYDGLMSDGLPDASPPFVVTDKFQLQSLTERPLPSFRLER